MLNISMGERNLAHTKFKDQTRHAKRRFRRHYHKKLTKAIRTSFKKAIEQNLAILVEPNSRGREIYDVSYKKDTYRLVYDLETRNIITFLPR